MSESSKDPRTDASVDGFFSTNYTEISRWAMEITSFDRSISEDLIHDAYLKLLRSRRDLSTVDPNAYVYVSMRNTYRSQIRATKNVIHADMPLLDDLLETKFFQDPRLALSVSDSLVEICEVACAKRRSMIAASLLILRYFLGYSIEDLSKVSNRSRNAVDTRLAVFRREIAGQLRTTAPRSSLGGQVTWIETKTFEQLRERIFRTPLGRCIPLNQLKRAYRWKSGRPDREELSHLVSCRTCLETANRLLKIDSLEQRHPLDILRSERLLGPVIFGALSFASQLGCGSFLMG